MADNFLRLLGGALGEPVVTEQRRDLVGVHQLTGHEGQRAERHLFTARQPRRRRWKNVDVKAGEKKKQNFLVTTFKIHIFRISSCKVNNINPARDAAKNAVCNRNSF